MVGNRKNLAIGAAVAAFVVAVAISVVSGLRDSGAKAGRDDEAFGVARASVPAPPITLERPDGTPLPLAELKGRVLFVNFWATWCPPCVEEMPSMLALGRELTSKYPERFRMVAVSVDEGWPEVMQFFRDQLPSEVLVARDHELAATRAYYCSARGACPESFKFPETYIVDATGRVVAYMVGPRDWSHPAARRVLERIIEG
jgi:thiol-disulfide isomerase/thioredoxin